MQVKKKQTDRCKVTETVFKGKEQEVQGLQVEQC